jgi:hypothetical protein
MMPGSDSPFCSVCGCPKSSKPWFIPIRAGTEDSFIKKLDGSLAKLDKRTVCGTGKGSSITHVFPIVTCDDNKCIHTAYVNFQASFSLSQFQWQLSLHQCATCKTSPQELLLCSRCKAVRYCSRSCQRKNWPKHKQHCYAK